MQLLRFVCPRQCELQLGMFFRACWCRLFYCMIVSCWFASCICSLVLLTLLMFRRTIAIFGCRPLGHCSFFVFSVFFLLECPPSLLALSEASFNVQKFQALGELVVLQPFASLHKTFFDVRFCGNGCLRASNPSFLVDDDVVWFVRSVLDIFVFLLLAFEFRLNYLIVRRPRVFQFEVSHLRWSSPTLALWHVSSELLIQCATRRHHTCPHCLDATVHDLLLLCIQ